MRVCSSSSPEPKNPGIVHLYCTCTSPFARTNKCWGASPCLTMTSPRANCKPPGQSREGKCDSDGPGDDEERGIVDGESAFVHHLHPCPQIGFSMSRRSLDFAALQLWCHCNPQYLRLLICCCPLSTLAFRLARTSNRHVSQRMAQHRAAALVMRRCFSMLAWRIWTGSTPN